MKKKKNQSKVSLREHLLLECEVMARYALECGEPDRKSVV